MSRMNGKKTQKHTLYYPKIHLAALFGEVTVKDPSFNIISSIILLLQKYIMVKFFTTDKLRLRLRLLD